MSTMHGRELSFTEDPGLSTVTGQKLKVRKPSSWSVANAKCLRRVHE